MRDRDHGLAFHQAQQLFLDRKLDFAVQGRGGFVEHQDRRVLQHHARYRHALALAAGELDAALADVRVVARAALPVLQSDYELVRLRFARGRAHLCVARAGAAIADIGGDRAMQERGVLRHHADRRAQAFLRDAADVLPVDADAAVLQLIEPQQQIDQRGLARARAPHQPHALAGTDAEAQAVQHRHRIGPAIGEAHILETNLAARHLQRARAGPVDPGVRNRNALHAFLHHADVLENAGDLPAHPAGHVGNLPGKRQHHGHHARADRALGPEPDARHRGAGEQRGIHRRQPEHELRDQLHVPADCGLVLVDRLAHIGVFVGQPREQFHGEDVGIAVHDARHHQRAHFRTRLCQIAHARHEVAQEHDVARKPRERGQAQPPVRGHHQRQRADAVDRDVPDAAYRRHHAFAQGVGGLHHAIGQASGKIVVEERQVLADQVPMALPADETGGARNQHVLADGDVGEHHEGANHQYQRHHRDQQRRLLRQGRMAVGGLHQRNQLADEYRDQGVDQRHRQAGCEHERVPGLGLAHEMPIESEQPWRRHTRAGARRGANARMQIFEHGR